jgi:hypothetical protein
LLWRPRRAMPADGDALGWRAATAGSVLHDVGFGACGGDFQAEAL